MEKPRRGRGRGRGRGRLNVNGFPPQEPGPHYGRGRLNVNGTPPQEPGPHYDGVQYVENGSLTLANSSYNSKETKFVNGKFAENLSYLSVSDERPYLHTDNGLASCSNHQYASLNIPKFSTDVTSICRERNQSSYNAASTNVVSKNLSSIGTLEERKMPKRPGTGKLGRPIQVKINYFPLSIPNGNVYHYDVEICNERDLHKTNNQRGPNISTCRKVMDALLNAYKEVSEYCPAYDGKKNLITRRELPFPGTQSFKVLLSGGNDRNQYYVVKIKAVKNENEEHVINLDELHKFVAGENVKPPLRAIMALDIIMRHIPSLKLTPVGKSLFHQPTNDELHPLGGGREIWFGYYQSVRPTQWKMMVNIDKAATVFYESQPVLNLVGKILCQDYKEIRNFSHDNIRILTKEMKGLKIKVTHQTYARKYKIFRVTVLPLSELTFPFTKNGEKINLKVTEYFKQQYKYNLKFTHLSGLDVGTKDNPKYLPMEVCQIVEGQHCKQKLSEKQTAEMIKFTAVKPEERFKEIENIAQQTADYNEAYMKEFGLQMNTKCIEATARVLHAPLVLYDNKKEIEPVNGVWDMKQKRFFKGVTIDNWVLISMANPRYCREEHLQKFSRMLCQIANSVGIQMDPVKYIKVLQRREYIIDVLKGFLEQDKLDLAVIVLPDKNASVAYSDIKQIAETQIGLKTQCVKETNVINKCTNALISNLCQKINAKMGGVNCGLGHYEKPQILKKPVIFMGADVTHPSPGDKTSVSIAAVVGSLDGHPSRYAASVRVQRSSNDKTARKIEIIQDLKQMVKELLREFRKNTGQKPEKIIFYRDGVSEGEFQKVQEEEVTKIRDACTELEAGYQPGITFVVVGKRHHMRMMPRNNREGVGYAKNVPPGTTVDTAVVHPTDFDFFLCSHFGIQGTSRPAHYTILCDDNDFTADEIQKLSYYLCHVYARCTRSISIPSPVQYAHLAAARAKQHLISKMEVNTTGSDSSGEQVHLTENMMNSVYVVKNFITSMYYV